MCFTKYLIISLGVLLSVSAWAQEQSPVQLQQMAMTEYDYQVNSTCLKEANEITSKMNSIQKNMSDDQRKEWRKSSDGAAMTSKLAGTFNPSTMDCIKSLKEKLENKISTSSKSEIIEDLSYQGYGVIARTTTSIPFDGCGTVGMIALEEGSLFLCDKDASSTNYSPPVQLKHPEVLIMKNASSGKMRLVVDKIVYDGAIIYRNH